MTTRAVLVILVAVAITCCVPPRLDAKLHRVGEWVHSTDVPAFRRCAPVEWADVTDHYGMALNEITERRYRSAAHHLDVAEAQYARAVAYVKSCPPGGRNPSLQVP